MPLIVDLRKAQSSDLPHGRGKTIPIFDPTNVARNLDVHMNILNPGVTAGAIHYHRRTEDVYIVLEGEGKILDKDRNEYPIREGFAIFFKPGEPPDAHEIYNTGKSPLRIIEIYAPAQPREGYFDRSKRDFVEVARTE